VSPVKYELRFYIPEDGILHSDRREILKSYKCILNLTKYYFNAFAHKNKKYLLLVTKICKYYQ
jgi:hypothetical protein